MQLCHTPSCYHVQCVGEALHQILQHCKLFSVLAKLCITVRQINAECVNKLCGAAYHGTAL